MGWIQKLGLARKKNDTAVIELIAHRSIDSVWQRVARRIETLAAGEIRGYVRARAAVVVRSNTQLALVQSRVNPTSESRLYASALELVVQQIASSRHGVPAKRDVAA